MSYAALSDDDSDHEAGSHLGRSRYAIVREAWRSEELIKWLRTIDLLALGEKWGGRLVAHRGNVRRLRIHSTRSKDGVAVIELPENCYDRDWLNSLNDYERKILNVQPPLDMTFSEDERLCALVFPQWFVTLMYIYIYSDRQRGTSHLRRGRCDFQTPPPTPTLLPLAVTSTNGSCTCLGKREISAVILGLM